MEYLLKKNHAEETKKTANISHAEIWGVREIRTKDEEKNLIGGKYNWLYENDIKTTNWQKLNPQKPHYFFIPQDNEFLTEYDKGWKITDIMPVNSVGIVTARDKLTIKWNEKEIWDTVRDFVKLDPETARRKYNLGDDAQDWKINLAQDDLKNSSGLKRNNIVPILYRPFDKRYTYYTGISRGFICRTRGEVMRHMLAGENLSLSFHRREEVYNKYSHFLATRYITEHGLLSSKTTNSQAPLYLYTKQLEGKGRQPNLSEEFIKEISTRLGITFIPDGKGDITRTFGPEDIFNYMYAIFHSPTYRKRYEEFLRIDFPKLPLTSNISLFKELAALGEEIVNLHLMEKDIQIKTKYPIVGSNKVEKPAYTESNRRVWINKEQYFEGIPESVWEFHIGGYQVCEKWLKDRKGRTLNHDDLTHYQKIIAVLGETIIIMNEIDETINKRGGWPIK